MTTQLTLQSLPFEGPWSSLIHPLRHALSRSQGTSVRRYSHPHVCTYTHAHSHEKALSLMLAHMYRCTCARTHTCILTYMSKHTRANSCLSAQTCLHVSQATGTCLHLCTCALTCAHTHTHLDTRVFTHARSHSGMLTSCPRASLCTPSIRPTPCPAPHSTLFQNISFDFCLLGAQLPTSLFLSRRRNGYPSPEKGYEMSASLAEPNFNQALYSWSQIPNKQIRAPWNGAQSRLSHRIILFVP